MADALHIRPASEEDAESILSIYEYYVKNTAITFEYDVPSAEEFRRRIRNTNKRYPYLVAEKNGRIIGYAYAGPFKTRAAYDWACELTIYLEHGAAGKGYGRLLYTALEKCLEQMGILNLYACITWCDREDPYGDTNSADFHAHLGYERMAYFASCGQKFGRWYDMVWMGKIIGQHLQNTAPIRSWPEVLPEIQL